ncbi:stonustoxin subunit beta-like [Rhinichthys klamathensis goyatoka]|uniref:stonustoxin subunit beta-like n=1 Tax=Rhinichthys klamathensis goyatoka TaxID=3034132 RepID=UPI0024B4F10A|nr:stonustoxin subunit beta-like [Rhinichthys klamathensis goyatoka]
MASLKELLLNSLMDLKKAEQKMFKWHLKNDHMRIKKSEMEKADILDTVDKMVACFGPEEAVKITVEILRKMNQNDLAEQLENNHKQVSDPLSHTHSSQAEGNMKTSAAVGAHSEEFSVDHGGEIRIKAGLQKYYHQFTLDPNTVNKHLRLSERNRVITHTYTVHSPYPDHPDRFDDPQVLCSESVCGRCYWEIEWSGSVFISVSYKSIRRKGWGNECMFGFNDQSWSLFCSSSSCSFTHNNIATILPVKSIIRRVGVYVDPSAGTLSFYSVDRDATSLIHTVQTTFTHKLYPGFRLYPLSSVKLC